MLISCCTCLSDNIEVVTFYENEWFFTITIGYTPFFMLLLLLSPTLIIIP